jgi:crotonobetainyl-CoA:carnitine CoA-transferase CaiB-like acyl-CoA transferase
MSKETKVTSTVLPLSDIRVIEFTHAVMGPSAGLVLADMGAEVIRVEPSPHGDRTRRLEGFATGYYTFFNRNKKSMAVDVKTDEGKEIVRQLLGTADALIENFAPGAMEGLGFGYEAVSAINPALIYCSLKGFMEGPYAHRTALDEVVQMMSGLAYMTGPPGQPMRAGASIVDITGGTYGAMAILVALRERDTTGKGKFVQTGLFESAAYIMGQHMAYALASQNPIPPMPARLSPWAVYRLFKTSDQQEVFIGITSDKHWRSFCRIFDRQDLLADRNLATNDQRVAARDRLHAELEAFFGGLNAEEIMARCEKAGIPYSPLSRPEDLFEDPQLNEGNSLVTVTLPDGREGKLPRLPLALNGQRFDLRLEAPYLGEHTHSLLIDLGYESDHIEALHKAHIIVASH